jgi:hypothetical protein
VIEQTELKSDRPYKQAFVEFIKSKPWHWFITIPIGLCHDDDEVVSWLRSIEALLCKKYLVNRYHRLPDEARFSLAVAFEGQRICGTRHAHILAHVPPPMKKRISNSMLASMFPFEFKFLWNKLTLLSAKSASDYKRVWVAYPWEQIEFGVANKARSIYTVKDVRQRDVSWSRFDLVTPPNWVRFKNKNLSVVRNRNRQRRAILGPM